MFGVRERCVRNVFVNFVRERCVRNNSGQVREHIWDETYLPHQTSPGSGWSLDLTNTI